MQELPGDGPLVPRPLLAGQFEHLQQVVQHVALRVGHHRGAAAQHVVAEGDEIAPKDLPDEITVGISKDGIVETGDAETDGLRVPFTADFREDRREFERRYISRCLEYTQGNVTRAAEILDMHRQSLQHKLRQLGLGRRYVSVSGDAQDNPDS